MYLCTCYSATRNTFKDPARWSANPLLRFLFFFFLVVPSGTMSQLRRTTALSRGLRAPATHSIARSAPQLPCSTLRVHYQTRWSSSENNPKASRGQESSFKSQMFESITQRMAREKQELRIAAKEREAKSGGRNVAQTIGEQPILSQEPARQDGHS